MKIAQYHDNHRDRLGVIHAAGMTPLDFDGDMIALISSDSRTSDTRNSRTLPLDQVKEGQSFERR